MLTKITTGDTGLREAVSALRGYTVANRVPRGQCRRMPPIRNTHYPCGEDTVKKFAHLRLDAIMGTSINPSSLQDILGTWTSRVISALKHA